MRSYYDYAYQDRSFISNHKVGLSIGALALAGVGFLINDYVKARVENYDLPNVNVSSAIVRETTTFIQQCMTTGSGSSTITTCYPVPIITTDYPVVTDKGSFQADSDSTISEINKRCSQLCTLKIEHRYGKIINVTTIIGAEAATPKALTTSTINP